MKKDKWPIKGSLEEMISKLKNHFKDAKTIEIDGVRLDFPDKTWLHLHPSNTEPITRLFGEATTEEKIENLFKEAKDVIFE
jgi:phosphomannomutase